MTGVIPFVSDSLERNHNVILTENCIGAEEIGIITPYYAQMKKIRTLLRHEQIAGVKVASVEEFQGQVC